MLTKMANDAVMPLLGEGEKVLWRSFSRGVARFHRLEAGGNPEISCNTNLLAVQNLVHFKEN